MKQTRAARLRRRRLASSASVVAVISVVVILATQLGASPRPHVRTTARPGAKTSPAASTSQTAAVTEVKSLHRAIARYVRHRHGAISAAVYDRNNGKLMVFHAGVRGRTASIVKADILETRLHQTNGELSASDQSVATRMIENSDNDSATDLFNEDGGASGLSAYDGLVGMTQTTPSAEWGDTQTSAADQVKLVRALLSPSKLLTNKARAFQRNLMLHVESDQRWGISGGVPKGVTVGNKNGWLPVDEDNNLWAVNSIGWVHGDGKSYVIAVITQHDATEDYGIDTIQAIASRTWHAMSTKTSS